MCGERGLRSPAGISLGLRAIRKKAESSKVFERHCGVGTAAHVIPVSLNPNFNRDAPRDERDESGEMAKTVTAPAGRSSCSKCCQGSSACRRVGD